MKEIIGQHYTHSARTAWHRYQADEEAQLEKFEWLSIKGFPPKLRNGMVAARIAARQLFQTAGVGEISLPRREGKAPLWPELWHGTLSHCGDDGIAAIARKTKVKGIGIDIEWLTVIDDATLQVFAQPDEIAAVGRDQKRRLELFCAKEAAYKAFHCQSDEWRDPHEISVNLEDSSAIIANGPTASLTRILSDNNVVIVLAVIR